MSEKQSIVQAGLRHGVAEVEDGETVRTVCGLRLHDVNAQVEGALLWNCLACLAGPERDDMAYTVNPRNVGPRWVK